MMKRFALLIIPIIVLVGCKNFEDLEAGNKLALENQNNLEKNTVRAFENYKKMLKLYAETVGDATEEAKKEKAKAEAKLKTAEAQQTETVTELAISRAWLLVIEEAIKKDSLNADFFGGVLKELPGWITQGKDVYDLIKSLKKYDLIKSLKK